MSCRYLALVLLLCISRTSAGEKAARPQEPKKPYPYRVEEVALEREEAAVKLAASLTLPKGDGPFAAALLVAPPGGYDRDLSHDGHKPFLVLADALTRQGLAVLRYDQRGMGKSTGNWAKTAGPAFIEDARAALSYLRGRKEIDPAKVGLLGHGEGGIVARLAAADRKETAWLVLVSAPEEGAGSPFGKVDFFKAKLEAFLRASAAPDKTGSWLFRVQARILETVRVRPKLENLQREIRQILAAEMPGIEKEDLADAARLEGLLGAPGWLHYRLKTAMQPNRELPALNLSCPQLSIHGQLDQEVPAKVRPKEPRELKNLNHWMQTCKSGSINEYGRIEETLASSFVERVGEWIQERNKK